MGPAPAYLARLRELHRELGRPADYAATRHLPLHEEAAPEDLVEIGRNPDGRRLELLPPAAAAWRRLRDEAAADGVELIAVSAFRSIARQTEIIRRKLDDGKPIAEILRYVA
ncbi:MAG: D-alanyl-D-alanine carboxypeptidase family protein, partial [Opitutaceae bacterium]